MHYDVGDKVEVCLKKGLPWFEGVVESIDNEHFTVKLPVPVLQSQLHGIKFKRDLKTDTVQVKRHLETVGLGYMHIRLKDHKALKPN